MKGFADTAAQHLVLIQFMRNRDTLLRNRTYLNKLITAQQLDVDVISFSPQRIAVDRLNSELVNMLVNYLYKP